MKADFIIGLESYQRTSSRGAVVTIGTFDGIHRGHQAILRRVKAVAAETGLTPVLVTFDPHPRVVISPDRTPQLLTTLQEKKQFVPSFFDGTVLVLEFDKELMNMTASDFITEIIVNRIGAKTVIVGYDHAFGKNRAGNIAELSRLGRELDFHVEVVGPVIFEGKAVSSTRIRTAMLAHNYDEAIRLLGHHYAIFGTVERGIGLGRKLGYPTANVKYSPTKLLPPEGVYSCWVQVGSEDKNGMMFIGKNHFNPSGRVTVEANLFDFDRDIYDEELVVYPTRFVRENQHYASTEELVRQIAIDKMNVLEILQRGETRCL